MTKKQKAEIENALVERYREGYRMAIAAVTGNLKDIADQLVDYDAHAASVLRWQAQLIGTYEPDQ